MLLVFISGEPLQSGSLGMSIPDSVCTERAVGVSQIPSYTEPQKLATVLSHMVGHNLGLKHDEDGKKSGSSSQIVSLYRLTSLSLL